MTKTILGIDPGSAKVGIAIVQAENGANIIKFRAVVDISRLLETIRAAMNDYSIDFAVIGNGTNSKKVQEMFRDCSPGTSLLILDEKETSIRARERYWEENPRRGWRRLLPSSLQVPPEPVDDFVAVILAESAINVD